MENPDGYFVAKYAQDLVVEIYRFLETMPISERYSLISQMRRSSNSVDDNIREGASAQSDSAMLPFLYHANKSSGELYRQFKKCRRLELGDQLTAKLLCRKAGRLQVMVSRLIRAKELRLGVAASRPPRRRRSPRRLKGG